MDYLEHLDLMLELIALEIKQEIKDDNYEITLDNIDYNNWKLVLGGYLNK